MDVETQRESLGITHGLLNYDERKMYLYNGKVWELTTSLILTLNTARGMFGCATPPVKTITKTQLT